MNATLLATVIFVATGCHNDAPISRAVGAVCDRASDCDERCLTGGKWPGGFCSISCDSSNDCPPEAICITDEGGVCAFPCDIDPDCDFLQGGYGCKDVDLKTGGKAGVCRGE